MIIEVQTVLRFTPNLCPVSVICGVVKVGHGYVVVCFINDFILT